MIYFDTSFLAPLVRQETTSEAVEQFFARGPQPQLWTSHWTRVEFCSGVARDVRMKALTPDEAAIAISDFESKLSSAFYFLSIGTLDCELARDFLQHYEAGLRAGDALHLAIAKNNNAETIYTLDARMLRAGLLLGLPVSRGIAFK